MPRIEQAPQSAEKPLGRQERGYMVDRMITRGRSVLANLELAKRMHGRDITAFAEIVTIGSELLDTETLEALPLDQSTQRHLVKMAALEMRRTPLLIHTPGEYELLVALHPIVLREFAETQAFPEDLSSVSRGWISPRNDLLTLSGAIRGQERG